MEEIAEKSRKYTLKLKKCICKTNFLFFSINKSSAKLRTLKKQKIKKKMPLHKTQINNIHQQHKVYNNTATIGGLQLVEHDLLIKL